MSVPRDRAPRPGVCSAMPRASAAVGSLCAASGSGPSSAVLPTRAPRGLCRVRLFVPRAACLRTRPVVRGSSARRRVRGPWPILLDCCRMDCLFATCRWPMHTYSDALLLAARRQTGPCIACAPATARIPGTCTGGQRTVLRHATLTVVTSGVITAPPCCRAPVADRLEPQLDGAGPVHHRTPSRLVLTRAGTQPGRVTEPGRATLRVARPTCWGWAPSPAAGRLLNEVDVWLWQRLLGAAAEIETSASTSTVQLSSAGEFRAAPHGNGAATGDSWLRHGTVCAACSWLCICLAHSAHAICRSLQRR